MKLEQIIKSALLGISLAIAPMSKAEDIHIYLNGDLGGQFNMQDYVDSAQPGDRIILDGDYGIANTPGWTDTKGLTYIGNGKGLNSDNINLGGNADSIFEDFGDLNGLNSDNPFLTINDSASFRTINGEQYTSFSNLKRGIVDNTSGKILIEQATLMGADGEYLVQINNQEGETTFDRDFLLWSEEAFRINSPSAIQTAMQSRTSSSGLLEIMNCVIVNQTGTGIKFNGISDVSGLIINNIVTGQPTQFYTLENAPNVEVTNNDFFNGELNLSLLKKQSASSGNNYNFDPLFVENGISPDLTSASQAWYLGRYVQDRTTYLDPLRPYIGASSNNQPEAIPEIKPAQAVSLGIIALGALYALAHKKPKHRINDYLSGKGKEKK